MPLIGRLLRPLSRRMGLDARVVSGLLVRFMGMAAAPISSIITVYCLTIEKQGLYYLFGSLLALRSLFELGAGMSVVQVSSSARGSSEDISARRLEPAFAAVVNRWMGRVSSIYAVAAGLIGLAFITSQGHGDPQTLGAWLLFVGISAFQFSSEGRWSMIEGANLVVEANRFRLKNTMLQFATQWLLLLVGAELFSFAIASLVAFLAQELYFRNKFKWLYPPYDSQSCERIRFFKTKLMGLIKKASQTYLTGYFVFQLQQPICFYFLGAEGSARLGFTQAVGISLIGLPSTWLAMNFPQMTHLVADGHLNEARSLFKSRYLIVLWLTAGAVTGAWGANQGLGMIPKFSERLIDPLSSAILYVGFGLQTIGLGLTFWPRAFQVEPFVLVAYFQMIATPLLLWYMGNALGIRGISIAIATSWLLGGIGIASVFVRHWMAPNPRAAL